MKSASLPPAVLAPAHQQQSRPSKRRRLCCAAAHQLAVIGGGAAGLAAAYFAADHGAEVVVMEKNAEAGKKILISGGARCNVLPSAVDPATDFFSESSQSALRSIFSRWSLAECQHWLEDPSQVGIKLTLEAETKKLFPASNSAKDVRDALVRACRQRGVQFVHGAALTSLQPRPQADGGGWRCSFVMSGREEQQVDAERVVLATGGKSFPSLGTDGIGYGICQEHGHSLHPPYAALTPLLGGHPGRVPLAGISVYGAQLSVAGSVAGAQRATLGRTARTSERTALLLTHRGWSGPAILDLSHYIVMAQERGQPTPALYVRWNKDIDRAAWEQLLGPLPAGGAAVAAVLRRQGLPARLADALCMEAAIPAGRKVSELRKAERAGLLDALTAYRLPVSGNEGYSKAEVTGGGVPLNELDCATMESLKMAGVHVCGELLDMVGRIGGFNFYFAWCSGRLAGRGAAAAVVDGTRRHAA